MKKMSSVDSKAGILLNNNSIAMLKNAISKSVFTLLMIMMATGAMSFGTIESSIDTNVNTFKSATRNLNDGRDWGRGKYRKIVYVSFPGATAVLKADREMFVPFAAGWNVTISTVNLAKKSTAADLEMSNNFIVNALYPLAGNAQTADEDMIRTFIEGNMVQPILQDAALIRLADETLTAAFVKEHFIVLFAAPRGIDALISDSEMGDAFAAENKLPGSQPIHLADAEINTMSKK